MTATGNYKVRCVLSYHRSCIAFRTYEKLSTFSMFFYCFLFCRMRRFGLTIGYQVSDPEKVKSVLTPASAAYLDYRSSVDQDPSFAKHFPIPQPVKASLRS